MGTPIYWYHVTAQFKMLVDRLYSFMEFGENPETGAQTVSSKFLTGKKFIFIISRGDPEPPKLFPQFYDHLNEWLNLIPMSLGAGKYEFFHQTDQVSIEKLQATIQIFCKKQKPWVPDS
jgi:multimeric flavodoxin WrbA